jgi:hypothetical protein
LTASEKKLLATTLAVAGAATGVYFATRKKKFALPSFPSTFPLHFRTTPSIPTPGQWIPQVFQRKGLAMWDSVKSAFWNFTANFEGATTGHVGVPFMYQDTKRLITTGIGNNLDVGPGIHPSPTVTQAALILPWLKADGTSASQADIANEWLRIRNSNFNPANGGLQYGKIATLHLSDAAIQNLVADKLKNNEAILISRFPGYPTWPADAQLGLLSWAWGVGPSAVYPMFTAALNATPPKFAIAAVQSAMRNSRRDPINQQLFLNAADVIAKGADPTKLYFPGSVTTPSSPLGNV